MTKFPFCAFVCPRTEHTGRSGHANGKKYREYAADCRRLAQTMRTKDRAVLLSMAEAWDAQGSGTLRRKKRPRERKPAARAIATLSSARYCATSSILFVSLSNQLQCGTLDDRFPLSGVPG